MRKNTLFSATLFLTISSAAFAGGSSGGIGSGLHGSSSGGGGAGLQGSGLGGGGTLLSSGGTGGGGFPGIQGTTVGGGGSLHEYGIGGGDRAFTDEHDDAYFVDYLYAIFGGSSGGTPAKPGHSN